MMGLLAIFQSKHVDKGTPVVTHSNIPVDSEKDGEIQSPSEGNHEVEAISSDAQAGVKAIEAAATVWTKYHLIGAYVM